jgi:hypothetical protein
MIHCLFFLVFLFLFCFSQFEEVRASAGALLGDKGLGQKDGHRLAGIAQIAAAVPAKVSEHLLPERVDALHSLAEQRALQQGSNITPQLTKQTRTLVTKQIDQQKTHISLHSNKKPYSISNVQIIDILFTLSSLTPPNTPNLCFVGQSWQLLARRHLVCVAVEHNQIMIASDKRKRRAMQTSDKRNWSVENVRQRRRQQRQKHTLISTK